MALKVEYRGTTSDSMKTRKPEICHTCKERREGLYTVDPYGRPLCSICAARLGRPIV